MALKPRPSEWLLGCYGIIVVVTGLGRMSRYPAAAWAAAAHALLLLLLVLFQSDKLGPLGRIMRGAAPFVLLLALYGALDLLSGFGAEPTHDSMVRRWERGLFGQELSRFWWQNAPSIWWSWILHAAYFGYYFVIPVPIVLALARRNEPHLIRASFALMATFVGCYLAFIFFPVAGPYYEYPRPAAWFTANPAAKAVYGVLASGSSYGAAFPSSHVAATWVAVAVTWPIAPRWGAALAVAAALLTVGVVYCQMHYGVDALAGIATAIVVIPLARWATATSDRSAPDS